MAEMIRKGSAGPSGLALLRGLETVASSHRGGWPGEEFLHPLPLGAMVVLALNDHWLKGSGILPGLVTGKLSDFAGLVFFPLFVTAAINSVLYGMFRLFKNSTVDYSLSRGKILFAIVFTALLFIPLQLSATWAATWEKVLSAMDVFGWFPGFKVTPDPGDLVAVAVFPVVYWHGRATLLRFPVGRLAVLRRRMETAADEDRERIFDEGTSDLRAECRTEDRRKALSDLGRAFAAFLRKKDAETEARAEEALSRFRRAR